MRPNIRATTISDNIVDVVVTTSVVGTSEVDLDCVRTEVRGVESYCGMLIAEALVATGLVDAVASADQLTAVRPQRPVAFIRGEPDRARLQRPFNGGRQRLASSPTPSATSSGSADDPGLLDDRAASTIVAPGAQPGCPT